MDLSLPGLNGIEATVEILRSSPDARIVILSMYDDEESVVRAIRSGARAFVLKKASHTDLIDALRVVANGGSYLSPQVSDKFLHRIQSGTLRGPTESSPLDVLTPRERQVMRLIAEGKTSKEVAVLLDLGHETVRSYRKSLMKKLGVSNVAELTQLALRYNTSALDVLAASLPRTPCTACRRLRPSMPRPPPAMDTPWGPLQVSDAHVHFFSHPFFSLLAAQLPNPASVSGLCAQARRRRPAR